MADKYLLRVTAGPSYDPTSHEIVHVNSGTPTHVKSPLCDANISVRIQNYRGEPSGLATAIPMIIAHGAIGLPRGSPSTSSYFSNPPHTHDQYSIGFSFTPRRTISGKSLVFGNDFEHPVRDRIPPGFTAAFRIVKWAIDPGLDGDVYADKPYLYGNALSSINVLSVGPIVDGNGLDKIISTEAMQGEAAITEGGFDGGEELRQRLSIPGNAAARQKWFLGGHDRLETWQWEEGRLYKADFFNPYLDFNEFALKLPGFSLKVLGYLGGEDYLRYVLKEKDTDEVLFVVVFTLLPKDQVEEEEPRDPQPIHSARTKQITGAEGSFEPQEDDLD
ncbi:MAG: hypothetical protein Q9170_004806 [Blastenia crenularia]